MADLTLTSITPPLGPGERLDYDAALRRIMSLADFERSTHSPGHWSFHLERMRLLMERLGSPHLQVPAVHVAGTKGKGSTAAMITSILSAQGYKTGLHTSPHLHSVTERIRIGMESISRQQFAELVEQVWPAVEETGRSGGYGGVTFFEAITAMSFFHFRQAGCDFQVQEVGLGGRLDSTNVVLPEVAVITSISLDHVATLGDTIAKIAYEKAGIIKPGRPVVVAPQPEEAMTVFHQVAAERNAPLVQVDASYCWQKEASDIWGQKFSVGSPGYTYDLWMPLLGDYQLENAATAIAAVETLRERGFQVSKESIIRGLRDVQWPARLEVLAHNGRTVAVDGAHNPYSVKRLVEAVRRIFRFERAIVLFGALGGHSARGMLAELAALSPHVVAVRSRHPRSTPSDQIAALVREQGLPLLFQSDNVGKATREALELAGPGDLVLGTGSLSVAAEVIEEMKGIPPEVYPYIKPPPGTTAQSSATI